MISWSRPLAIGYTKQTYKEARNRDRVRALSKKIARPRKRPLGCTNQTKAYRLRTSGVIHTGQHCPSSVQPCRSFEAMSELWSLFFDTSSDVTLLSLPSNIETAESPLASTQSSMTTYVLAPRSKVQILFWRRTAPCSKPKNELSIKWNETVHQVSFDMYFLWHVNLWDNLNFNCFPQSNVLTVT